MGVTGEQLLQIFADYNAKIWPMQFVGYFLGIVAVILAFKSSYRISQIIAGILAFFWLWVGLVFWLPYAVEGFFPAYIFSALFVVQGILFVWQAIKPKLYFGTYNAGFTWVGMLFIAYAMIGYLFFGYLIGHTYPRTPPFGLTPCPLIIFKLGMFMLTRKKIPLLLLVIPFFYSLSGILWVSVGILEDIGLVAAALICVGMILWRDYKLERKSSTA
jgi:hypothetical protein